MRGQDNGKLFFVRPLTAASFHESDLVGYCGGADRLRRRRGVCLAAVPARSAREGAVPRRREFHRQREMLEARFVQRAAACGKPRGLRWTDCDFSDDVTYARDRRTSRLSALVAVTIAFEAVEGGGMEENENVGNLRAASAVFNYDRATGQPTAGPSSISTRPKRSASTRPTWNWSPKKPPRSTDPLNG